jgi:hypothetical protein
VVWPNGARLDAAMLALIYHGFGARKGWPTTAPPVPADAPFSVPALWTAGGHPADWVQPTSTSLRRLEALQTMLAKVAAGAAALRQWWAEDAQARLPGELSSRRRRALLGRARAEAGLLQLRLGPLSEQLTQTAGLDAIAEGDPELRSLVQRAKRWNYWGLTERRPRPRRCSTPWRTPRGFAKSCGRGCSARRRRGGRRGRRTRGELTSGGLGSPHGRT